METERVIAGRNPVREALEHGDGRIEKVLMQAGAHGSAIDAIRRVAKAAGVPVQVVPAQKLTHAAPGVAHQGVVALAVPVAFLDLDELAAAAAPDLDAVRATKPLLVALDEVEDPHNFGAIIRSAVGAGAAGMLIPERRSAPLSPVAVKASAGTALRLPLARVPNLADALVLLKERGYWIVGLEGERPDDEVPTVGAKGPERVGLWTFDGDRPLVLVVGNEGRGLRPRVAAACDFLAAIPMRGPAESLNASVAAGIALFALVRNREPVPGA